MKSLRKLKEMENKRLWKEHEEITMALIKLRGKSYIKMPMKEEAGLIRKLKKRNARVLTILRLRGDYEAKL